MTDLMIAFVRARLDEEEAIAEAAAAGVWRMAGEEPDEDVVGDWGIESWVEGRRTLNIYEGGGHSVADTRHIIAWQPSRVRGEIRARRDALRLYELALAAQRRLGGQPVGPFLPVTVLEADSEDALIAALRPGLHVAIAWAAQVYAGHPGWDEEWTMSS